MIRHFLAAVTMILLLIPPLHSDEAEPKKMDPKKYYSATSFSALLIRGNNKDFTLSIDTDHNLVFKKDKLNLKANVIYATSNSEKKSEIYSSSLNYNRRFNTRAYFLGVAKFSRNILAGYNSRFAFSTGAGYSWIKKEKINVSSEIALGWSSENNAERLVQQIFGSVFQTIKKKVKASFVSSVFSSEMLYNLTDSASFSHQEILFLNFEELEAYRINSNSSISAEINKHFALKTSLQLSYENIPVTGYDKTDLYILSSLVFKL